MRIAIGGMMHESNTFARTRTERQHFESGSLAEGRRLREIWQDAHHEVGGFLEAIDAAGHEAVPLGMAWAPPGGVVSDAFFEEFVGGLVERLGEVSPDGVLLALHGAMVTPQHPSADTELLRRVRQAIGPYVPMAVTLDYHGNVTPEMAAATDIILAYQTYPHVDQRDCGRQAATLLLRTLRQEIRPVCEVVRLPLLMPLLAQETDQEPMRSLLEQARRQEMQLPLLRISLLAGFPYADVPAAGSSVVAVADGDRAAARRAAQELASQMWGRREQMVQDLPDAARAVELARQYLASGGRPPVLLVDFGDNIGGGTPGDSTLLLEELLRQKVERFLVVLYAPTAVSHAQTVGPGGTLEVTVGGSDSRYGPPLTIRGTVQRLHDGRWEESAPRHGGRRYHDQGPTAVLDLGQGRCVVLNSLRTPPFSLGQITSLGLEPQQFTAIVVKAAVAYKAAYGPVAGTVIVVDTPGITPARLERLDYRHIHRPIFPLDADATFASASC